MIKITIDRSKWGRSELYNPKNNTMCAMGFIGNALGIPKEAMAWESSPRTMDRDGKNNKDNMRKWGIVGIAKCDNGDISFDSHFIDKVIDANDGLTDGLYRERYLTSIFASKGLELEFI